MTMGDVSAMHDIAKRELDRRGFVVRLSTRREGDHLVGRLQVSSAATDETVARFVTVGRVDDLELVVGFDASEGILKELLGRATLAADLVREFLPSIRAAP